MRLIELYSKLKDIKLPNNIATFSQEEELKKNYKKLRLLGLELNILFSETPNIENIISVQGGVGKISTFAEIQREINVLKGQIDILLSLLKGIIGENYPQNENTINIKLQDNITSLQDFSKTIEEITLLFKMLRISDYKIVGVDRGSNWLEVIINNSPQLVILISVIYGALKMRESYYKGSNQQSQSKYYDEKSKNEKLKKKDFVTLTESLKKVEELLKNVKSIDPNDRDTISNIKLKHDLDEIIQEILNNLNKKYNIITSDYFKGAELENAIKLSLYKILELMEENIEIQPSLNSPKWLKEDENGQRFIDYDSLKKITKTLNQIENKAKDKS